MAADREIGLGKCDQAEEDGIPQRESDEEVTRMIKSMHETLDRIAAKMV